ncbi:hypothetical protein RZO50_07045 [Microbacterium sp. SSW1-59]|uniref:hypothetical protein n=1 Tax=Microbacterium xanthum TaxID=3079794 RepID=UPI002AD43719|nr:hypothetical protein [Microbacterium sp. SSW1-59]MDZ8201264.1 hypothetical protein [Microbacterium sp. SSW1-59]
MRKISDEMIPSTSAEWLARWPIPLIWQGRLSWMRITLGVVYGYGVYKSITPWKNDTPERVFSGWLLAQLPRDLIVTAIANADLVALALLILVGLVVVGLATRFALFSLATLGLFVEAVGASQGIFDHESSLTTQVLFVLAFCPGVKAISLDNTISWLRAGRPPLWQYFMRPYRSWGIYIILGILAITYTTSGISKLRFGGLQWLNGETLGYYLSNTNTDDTVLLVGGGPDSWRDDLGIEMYVYGNFREASGTPLDGVIEWVAGSPVLLAGIAVATVVLELAGLLLFVPKVRSLLLISYIAMHTTIGIMMGLWFTEYRLICFFLIEWELVGLLLLRASRRSAREVMHTEIRARDGQAKPSSGDSLG